MFQKRTHKNNEAEGSIFDEKEYLSTTGILAFKTHFSEVMMMMMKCKFTSDTKLLNFKSSRPEVFCKKGVLRNFAKFTGKHLFE